MSLIEARQHFITSKIHLFFNLRVSEFEKLNYLSSKSVLQWSKYQLDEIFP